MVVSTVERSPEIAVAEKTQLELLRERFAVTISVIKEMPIAPSEQLALFLRYAYTQEVTYDELSSAFFATPKAMYQNVSYAREKLPRQWKSLLQKLGFARSHSARLLDTEVADLRREGKTINEMALFLSTSVSTIKTSVGRQIRSGKIESKRASPIELTRRNMLVAKLRKEGVRDSEIARMLEISKTKVKSSVNSLRRRGKIEPLWTQRGIKVKVFAMLEQQVVQNPGQQVNIRALAQQLGADRSSVNKYYREAVTQGRPVPERC